MSSAKEGQRIQATTGKTYYTATKLLPERVRPHVFALYGFVRTADTMVDETNAPAHEQRKSIEEYRRRTIAAIREPNSTDDRVLKDFANTVRECRIPELEIHAFLDAMATDASKKTYKDLHEVQQYMRGSATAVGNMMLPIMEFTGDRETVKRQARALAEAFQMTNFLRDVKEDYKDRGRIYLPQTTLAKYGITESELAQTVAKGKPSPQFRKAMAELSIWTRNQYHDGIAGIKHLSADCRFGVLVAAILYVRVQERIEKADYDVFKHRARLTKSEKARIVASTWVRYKVLKQSELRCAGLIAHK
jgi:phytoene synthase